MYSLTTATRKIAKLKKKIRAVQGGTSASKTISILLYLIDRAQSDKTATLTSVISESFPHLRRGAMRDFKNIMTAHNYWKDDRWNVSESTYTFETGSQIEFFSADQSDKLRGARRDRCFMNEANNMTLDVFDQLEVRTKELLFMDWNPSNEFWFYTDIKPNREDVDHITLTYKDNEALSPEIVSAIEARKNRKGWWQVYGLGQLGEVEGKIYKDWQIIDTIPHEARYLRTGLDFGYTNDPSAIVDVYRYNGGLIWDELTYQKGLSNKQLADILLADGMKRVVVADAAEPKSIDEIKSYGVTVLPSNKGAGSVAHRIQTVQAQRISLTKRSANVIKEYRNYLWETDKDGKILNEPEHQWSHSMDAGGYATESIYKTENEYVLNDILQAQFSKNIARRNLNSTR
jgi:phage terminase large subunit